MDFFEDHHEFVSDEKYDLLSGEYARRFEIMKLTHPSPPCPKAVESIGDLNEENEIGETEFIEATSTNDVEESMQLTPRELLGIMSRSGYPLLHKHYNRTSKIGEIALVLDPRKNQKYMIQNEWPQELIDTILERC
jgi:hypothetical protein